MSAEPWLSNLFSAIDRLDVEAFCAFLAEDCVFRFENGPAIRDRETIGQTVDAFFRSFKALRHELDTVIAKGDHVACYGWATYTRPEGTSLRVPFADHFALRGQKIAGYLIFIDLSELGS